MSLQSFPNLIFTSEKSLNGNLREDCFANRKHLYTYYLSFIKGNTIAQKFSLRSHFSVFIALQAFLRILVLRALFLSYMLGEVMDFSFFSKSHKEIH